MTLLLTQLRAIMLFYRVVAPFTLGITAALGWLVLRPAVHEGLAGSILPAVVLAKLVTEPIVWYLSERLRPGQYWLYYNLGLSRQLLWSSVAALDGALFIGVIVLIVKW